jgi:hypothetical protein
MLYICVAFSSNLLYVGYIVLGFTAFYNHNVKTVTAHCYEYDKSSDTFGIHRYDLESFMSCIIRACDYKSDVYKTLDCFKRNNTSLTHVVSIIMNYYEPLIT